MNTNFGLFPPVSVKTRDKDQKRRLIQQQRAVEDFDAWIAQSGFLDVLLVQDGASPQTVRAYASDLAQFQAFAGTVLNARGVLPLEVGQFGVNS